MTSKKRLVAWVWISVMSSACTPAEPEPGELPLRRLTASEYNLTIRDLFGYPDNAAWSSHNPAQVNEVSSYEPAPTLWPFVFPAELGVDGFDGIVGGQVSSPYVIEQYSEAAARFAPFILESPRFSVCGPWDSVVEAEKIRCATESIALFAKRAYRRPLDRAQESRLDAFHQQNMAEWGVDDGTILTVQGILQSPNFIFLIEHGVESEGHEALGHDVRALSSWEMASRLSFFFWDSMPDEELFSAAERNELRTREQVQAQAHRMVRHPRAREAVVQFHRQWLEIDEVYTNRADLMSYAPLYDPTSSFVIEYAGFEAAEPIWSGTLVGLRRAMDYEASHFIEDTIFEGEATLRALLTDHHGYVSHVTIGESPDSWRATTADVYGVTPADEHDVEPIVYRLDDGLLPYEISLVPATLPARERAGVLTLGAVLAGRSSPVHPSPIRRGAFIVERMACEHISQPPPSAASEGPPDIANSESTNRERVVAATSAPTCAACHQQINPAGFAFEHYDSMGGYRVHDGQHPVDAAGTLTLSEDGPVDFSDAVELAGALSESVQVHDCYAKHWINYAIGRTTTDDDSDAVRTLQERFIANQGDIPQLMVDIATSHLFRFRRTLGEP